MDPSYGEPEECLVKGRGELGGAYIVRLPCGPPETYVRKELLWPYVREFADRGIEHATNMLAAMAEAGRRCELYVVHGEGRAPTPYIWLNNLKTAVLLLVRREVSLPAHACSGMVVRRSWKAESSGVPLLCCLHNLDVKRPPGTHATPSVSVCPPRPPATAQGTMPTRARWPC